MPPPKRRRRGRRRTRRTRSGTCRRSSCRDSSEPGSTRRRSARRGSPPRTRRRRTRDGGRARRHDGVGDDEGAGARLAVAVVDRVRRLGAERAVFARRRRRRRRARRRRRTPGGVRLRVRVRVPVAAGADATHQLRAEVGRRRRSAEKMPSRPAGAPGGDGGGGGDGTGDGGGPEVGVRQRRRRPQIVEVEAAERAVPFDALPDELDASAHGVDVVRTATTNTIRLSVHARLPGGIGGRIVPACRSGGAFGGGGGGMVHRLPRTSGSTPAPSGPGWGGQRRTILCGGGGGTPRAPPGTQPWSVVRWLPNLSAARPCRRHVERRRQTRRPRRRATRR